MGDTKKWQKRTQKEKPLPDVTMTGVVHREIQETIEDLRNALMVEKWWMKEAEQHIEKIRTLLATTKE